METIIRLSPNTKFVLQCFFYCKNIKGIHPFLFISILHVHPEDQIYLEEGTVLPRGKSRAQLLIRS